MKINLDSQVIELTCPHCGHKLQESIGKLKTNPTLICGKCQGRVKIDVNNMSRRVFGSVEQNARRFWQVAQCRPQVGSNRKPELLIDSPCSGTLISRGQVHRLLNGGGDDGRNSRIDARLPALLGMHLAQGDAQRIAWMLCFASCQLGDGCLTAVARQRNLLLVEPGADEFCNDDFPVHNPHHNGLPLFLNRFHDIVFT
jgi:hypothetical protein